MPLAVWQPKAYIESSQNTRLGLGLYYGALAVMLFYNLFIFVSVRDKSYLYYISYLFSIGVGQMAIDGVASEFLWPNTPLMANIGVPVFMNLTVMTSVLFAREYLAIKQVSRGWEYTCRVLIGLSLLNFLPVIFGSVALSVTACTLLLICMSVLLLSLGAWGIYNKQRRAYFFFAAWLSLCIGASVKAAQILNFVPVNFFTSHGGQFGVLIEAILLSLALADRINQDRAEKLYAMNDALASSKQALKAIDERREIEQRLIQQSLYDSLTGQPNKVLFSEQVQKFIAQSDKQKNDIVTICIHLNNFHDINNTLGHGIGDQIIVNLSSNLDDQISRWNQVIKISAETGQTKHLAVADGVYLLISLLTKKDHDISDKLQLLIEAMDEPLLVSEMTLTIEGHIGIAKWPTHGDDADTLIQKSMIAVRAAKRANRKIQFFDKDIDQYSAERISLINDLKKALIKEELELRYQPKVDLKTEKVVSMEALIRWNHPEKGLLGPDKFIDFAESTEIIQPLTQWVLNQAIEHCVQLIDEGYEISVAVNVSARNLLEDSFVKNLSGLLKKHRLKASNLTLEVLENSMIEDMSTTIKTLKQLDKLGVHLSIDDFGTGYSSLAYLKKLPVHELKIDRSFIKDMVQSEEDKLIVSTSLAIAHQRNMNVVAEGIEDKATFNLLTEMGCDIGQGYFISKPIKYSELVNFLHQKSTPTNSSDGV